MIQYILGVGDKTQTIQFPTGYNDLTYGQFLRLRLEYRYDVGSLLDILTGIPRSVWFNLPVSEADKITKSLQWILDSPLKWDELQVPAKLEVAGQLYDIPKDLGLETFGQKITLEEKIAKVVSSMMRGKDGKKLDARTPKQIQDLAVINAQSSLISIIPFCVAVYMQPRISGKAFDDTELVALEHEILKCRAVEVYPLGNFFIRSLLGSAISGATHSLQQQMVESRKVAGYRKRQVSKKSKKARGTS